MKKVDLIILIICVILISLLPIDKMFFLYRKVVIFVIMMIYPMYCYIHHTLLSYILKIYIKDFIKSMMNDIEKKCGKDFVNKIIIDIILPFDIYRISDIYVLIDNIAGYVSNNLEINDTKEWIDFFDNHKFETYVDKIFLQKKANSLNGVNINNSLDKVIIQYLNFFPNKKVDYLRIIFPNKSSVVFWLLILLDFNMIFLSINENKIFLEIILTIIYFALYSIETKNTISDILSFIIYWFINMVISAIFIFIDATLFMEPKMIIVVFLKLIISILAGNKAILLMVMKKEDFNKINVKSSIINRFLNIFDYKIIDNIKTYILWLMFILIIMFNIITFAFISYGNIMQDSFFNNTNASILLMCLKNSLSNYFTNSYIFYYEFKNEFMISTLQTILSYFTNVLLIANIVKNLTEPKSI